MINKEILIDAGANCLTSATSLIDPIAGLLGTALSPIISNGIKNMIPKSLSQREEKRVEIVCMQIKGKISSMLDQGRMPRMDDSYYAYEFEVPNAQEIFEGVILKAREEHQAKKLSIYSNFFANLCFDETINIEHAFYLLGLIERLTYRQLAILAYMSDGKEIKTSRWDPLFKEANSFGLTGYYDLYSEYVDLYNLRLVTQTSTIPGFALGMAETKISDMGLTIVKLTELPIIVSEDADSVKQYFEAIDLIISRIHK